MKSLFKNILVLSAIALGVSCQKNDVESLGENVKIFVDIEEEEFTRVSDDGSCFVEGDQIQVENTSRSTNNSATFIFDGSAWSTNGVILWEGQGVNEFHAWHPATASFGNFTIPSDQSEGLGQSDWMTASASATPADGGVKLGFKRHLSKVTVEIVGWGDEYLENAQTVDRLDLISLSGMMNNIGKAVIGDDNLKTIQTYVTERNKSMVAIIAPGEYTAGVKFMEVYVNGCTEPLKVTTAEKFTFKPNMAYVLKLKIGKDCLQLASDQVSVKQWDNEDLGEQNMVAEAGRNELDYIDEYGINHGQGAEIDGVIWAPVNCGYHATDYKYGKLYQWGRKYGLGYEGDLYDGDWNQTCSDASVASKVSGPVSLSTGQSTLNADIFYSSSSSPYDWISPQDDNLWNSGTEDNPIKAVYDPCPKGWRVPTFAELNKLKSKYWTMTINDGQNGCMFSGKVFFPAAGYLDCNSGIAYARGKGGCYWSSKPYDPGAHDLNINFDGGYGVVMEGTFRANAYSVRCVKE